MINKETSSWSKKQDFQNEEELLFTAFNQLAFSAFNGIKNKILFLLYYYYGKYL